MTTPPRIPTPAQASAVERFRRVASRVGLVVITVLLGVGLALSLAGYPQAPFVLATAVGFLLAVAVGGVVVLVVDVTRRREWPFAIAAWLVALMIAYSLVQKIARL